MASEFRRKRSIWQHIGTWFQRALAPGARAWRGASWGALAALVTILLATGYGLFGQARPGRMLVGTVFIVATFALAGGLLVLIWQILRRIPAFYMWVLACAVPALALMALTAISVSIGIVAAGLGTLAAASLVGAGIAALSWGGWARLSWSRRIVALGGTALGTIGLVAGGAWLLDAGTPPILPPDAAAGAAAAGAAAEIERLDLPDPSQPGPYAVRTLSYGSGHDRHRPEYGPNVDLVTGPVDGSTLVERWSPLRTAYWGFGPDALPLNGRVWYPEGEGPYPLVLIVHGQHPMEDFSDPGYAYLGELLASRGFIVASVDENYLNLSLLADLIVFQSLIEEDDLRGWLLLEHLQAWRNWNADPGSPFYQKVDLERIALIGHSRGGEAVAVATAFNKLPYYPDNASLRFDYGFNIRSVVAFAPAGAYQPAGQDIVLENVNYFVLHGAHDMDVFTFQGLRQYERVRWDDGGQGFKAALYIYGANHGQFNTSWGRKDLFEPVMRVFNLQQLMPGAEQRQVAKVTISAFLEATLQDRSGYQALFQDLRRGRAWLPDTIYLHQYHDAATQMVSTYEEDVDLTSTTLAGGRLTGKHLTVWREQPAQAKWEDLGNQTVYLGWDGAAAETAGYAIRIPERSLALGENSVLVFSMADAGPMPAGTGREPKERGEGARQPIDLTVEVMDGAGEIAHLPLSRFSFLQPQLEAQLGKAAFMSPFPTSETVLQHFRFPLEDFGEANAAFDPARLVQVRLVFDRTEVGVIVLDDVGFWDEVE